MKPPPAQAGDEPTQAETEALRVYNANVNRAKPHLLCSMTPDVFNLLKFLASSNDVEDITYQQMKDLLVKHPQC